MSHVIINIFSLSMTDFGKGLVLLSNSKSAVSSVQEEVD